MADSSYNEDLINIMQNLKNVRLQYHLLYYPEENFIESIVFENAESALNLYISASEYQNTAVKCLITASLGNYFYSSVAPITLRSITDIVDAYNEISVRIEERAKKQ